MTTSKLGYLLTRLVRAELSMDDYHKGMPVVMHVDDTYYEPWVKVHRTEGGPVLVIEPRYVEEDAVA